jgi:hypothetical protein
MIGRLFPFLFILISAGILYFYVYPTYSVTITTANQQIESYNAALAAAEVFTQKEDALVAEKNAIPAPQLARLEEFLPDGVNNIQLILDLNSLAQRSGVSLSNFTVQDNQTPADSSSSGSGSSSSGASTASPSSGGGSVSSDSTSLTDSLDLSVTATGTYAAFQTFLAASEQSLRPLDVTSLTLKDSATGVYMYNITYRIYWLN